jgi:hypothetical protein
MSVAPESIQAGQCYLMRTGHVRRAITLHPGRGQYETRGQASKRGGWAWRSGIVDLRLRIGAP